MRTRRKAGIIGIAGVVMLLICAVISAAAYEDGPFSPANRFITELGYYNHGYFVLSPAFIFNMGMILSGLLLCIFSVMYGIRRGTPPDTAAGFFGVTTGILLSAQGLVTLNYSKYHLLISGAFFASVFLMCLFNVISQVRYSDSSITALIFSFLAGAASVLSSVYIFIGGLNTTFQAGAAYADRADIMPCAIMQWGVYVMLLLLFLVQSTSILAGAEEAEDDVEDDYSLAGYEPKANYMPKADYRRPVEFEPEAGELETDEPEANYESTEHYRSEADYTPADDYGPEADYTPTEDDGPEEQRMPSQPRGHKLWGSGRDIEL
jgi:hypothetical membrane protein